jgi:transcriptional regulator with XRE-family HTH domain
VADQERTEDLAQLLARLMNEYDVNASEIGRRIGVAASTVSSWKNRTRAGKRGAHPDSLRALAREFPKFSEDEIFAAAGRESPGPLDEDGEARMIKLWRDLTAEQRRAKEVEMRALGEMNRTGQ